MLASGLNRALLTLMLLCVVAGCSKNENAEIENLLENYYRAVAKSDADKMDSMGDHSMFTLTIPRDQSLLFSKFYQRVDEMGKLSNANGELKKIKIIKVDSSKDDSGEILLVEFNLVFKNDQTILKKEIISRQDGKVKLLIFNEWK